MQPVLSPLSEGLEKYLQRQYGFFSMRVLLDGKAQACTKTAESPVTFTHLFPQLNRNDEWTI